MGEGVGGRVVFKEIFISLLIVMLIIQFHFDTFGNNVNLS